MPVLKGLLRKRGQAALLGQSLTEYSVAIALVVLVVTPALILFGGQLKNAWQGFNTGISPTKRTQVAITNSTALQQAMNATVRFQTAKGTMITLNSALSNPLDKNISTLGANGTTAMLADSLSNVAKQLLDSGDISQTQYNVLIQLSNAGHTQAQLQTVIEQAMKNMPQGEAPYTYMANTQVTLNGKTSSLYDIWNTLSYGAPNGGYRYFPATDTAINTLPTDLLHPPSSNVLSSLSAFLDVYHQAESSGALSDPAVAQVVSSLSTQIALSSDTLMQAVGEVYLGHSSAGQIPSLEVSVATNMNSAGICTTGNGTDSGVQCSP